MKRQEGFQDRHPEKKQNSSQNRKGWIEKTEKLTAGDEESEILGTFPGISLSSCWVTEAVRFREVRAVAEEKEEDDDED